MKIYVKIKINTKSTISICYKAYKLLKLLKLMIKNYIFINNSKNL